MNRVKKRMALLLALALCLSLLSLGALADGEPGAEPAEAAAPAAEAETLAADGVPVDAAHFPDGTFRSYVRESFDKNGDGVLSDSELAAATPINVNDKNISSLAGIEYFTALKTLACSNNRLTALDVSGCEALTSLWCSGNALTELDVSGCAALTELLCSNNQLTSLNVSGCAALRSLSCYNNDLTVLDVSRCETLVSLLSAADYDARPELVSWETDTGSSLLSYDRPVTLVTPEGEIVVLMIVTEPVSATDAVGQTARFTVEARSSRDLTYQWHQRVTGASWTDVSEDVTGHDAATLELTVTEALDRTYYRCVVSDGHDSVISDTVTLTVRAAAPDRVAGDATGDGKLDGRDLLRLQKHLAGMAGATADLTACDVTGDGRVDGRDLLRLQKYLAGIPGTVLT